MSRDEGSATVEFVLVGLLMLVPVAYLLLAALEVQRAAYGVVEGARSAGRAYVTAPSAGSAETRARAALDLALGDQRIADAAVLRVDCSAHPCLTPSATVRVTVEADVGLPFVPDVLGGALSMHVSAVHFETVDPFQAARP